MSACPDCHEEIAEEARRCRACGRWLRDAKCCPQCGETVLEVARVCRYCGYDFVADPLTKHPAAGLVEGLPHKLVATPLGGMICESSITALFRPPEMQITEDEISVTRWTMLTLRNSRQKVSLSRIASVRHHKGIFWSRLIVETFGGSIADLEISGVDIKEAKATAALLEKIMQSRKNAPPSSPNA